MGKGRAVGRVRFFVGNRGSGQLFAETGGSGPRKVTRPWTTLGNETCTLSPMARWLNRDHVFTIVCMDEVKWKVLGVEDSLLKVKK